MLAKTLLIRNGEFFPFAATVGKRGKFTLVTPLPETETPTAHDVLDAIVGELQEVLSTIRACAIVAMAATETGVDAVRVELEHASGPSLVIALPYARGELGAFAYGDMEAHRTAPRLWVKPPKKKTPPAATARPSKAKAAETVSDTSSQKTSGAAKKATPKTPSARGSSSTTRARKPRPSERSPLTLHAQPALF